MGKLTSKARSGLVASQYGLPATKRYPMPDKAHAVNAEARATQQVKAGKLSPAQKAKIDAKAQKVINRSAASHGA